MSSVLSISLKVRLLHSKKIIYIDNVVRRCKLYSSSDSEAAETDVVEVSANASEKEDTSDDAELEDAHANQPLADENWLAQNEAEEQKEQELDGLASVAISTGVEEEAYSLTLLLQCFAPGSTSKL